MTSRIIIERLDCGLCMWLEVPKWSEDFDGHFEDIRSRALAAMAELEIGCGIGSALRARCVPDQEHKDEGWEETIFDQSHKDYEEAREAEKEAERERADELKYELRAGR